eukprot:9939830-Alexandrium_andersonii.AAC.1
MRLRRRQRSRESDLTYEGAGQQIEACLLSVVQMSAKWEHLSSSLLALGTALVDCVKSDPVDAPAHRAKSGKRGRPNVASAPQRR